MKLIHRSVAGSYRGRFVIALVLIASMLLLRYLGVGKYINLAFIWENSAKRLDIDPLFPVSSTPSDQSSIRSLPRKKFPR